MFASKDLFLTPPSAGGYTIARSVRFRASAQGYFSKTLTTPTNNKKWTYSVWMKRGSLSANRTIMSSNVDGAEYWDMRFNTSDQIFIQNRVGSSNLLLANTTAVYRDPSAWYHIVFVFDSSNATAANRNLLYVNGVNVALSANSGSSDASAWNTSGVQHNIGVSRTFTSGGGIWAEYDGYETEINFIDGQALTPSSFGTNNATTGVWQPAKYTGTYGTNGFYLNFSDNSSNTATTIGKDYSGNGNNWTPNNISVTAGSTYDSMVDSPTVSAVSSNYAVMNPLDKDSTITASDGNLYVSRAAGAYAAIRGSIMFPTSGKYYAEATVVTTTASGVSASFGFSTDTAVLNNAAVTGQYILYGAGSGASAIYSNGSSLGSLGVAFSAGDVLQVAFDGATGKAWVGKNNVWYNATAGTTGDPANGTNNTFSLSGLNIFPVAVLLNDGLYFNAGQRPFSYTPPTGYVALNTYNLPASTITNGAAYMAATLYTGTGASLTVANTVGSASFQPDFVWVKGRSGATDHALYDSVRGVQKQIESNNTDAETTETTGLTAFGSTGFTVGALAQMNTSSATYVGWQWKAGTTSSSNTNGSITSTVSAGATQGFSVVTYTGNGTAGATIGHGLGVVPTFIIVKNRSSTQNWLIYSAVYGANMYGYLNNTNPWVTDTTGFNNVIPTSTVFSVGTALETNGNGNSLVAYCFTPVKGYSAFGSYTGNGSADGPFVYLGFRPRWLMIKRSSSASVTYGWQMYDTSRQPANTASSDPNLWADTSAAEGTGNYTFDLLSNGFKLRSSGVNENASGDTYIYAAFAENPFKNALAR